MWWQGTIIWDNDIIKCDVGIIKWDQHPLEFLGNSTTYSSLNPSISFKINGLD